MRKLKAVILLSLFAGIQVGILAWYCYRPVLHAVCYQLFQYHGASENHEVGANHETAANRVEQMKLSQAGLRAARSDDGELSINGELYDIIKTVVRGDSVLLTVEKDITENRWFAACSAIQQQLTNKHSGQAPPDFRIYQWMFKLYVPSHSLAAHPSQQEHHPRHCLLAIPLLTSGFYHTPGQPPEQVS